MKNQMKKPAAPGRVKFGLRHLRRDERGMSTVEYVILLAVIVVGAVGIWKDMGTKIKASLGTAESEIQGLPE